MDRSKQLFIEPLEPRELLALVPQTITVRVFLDRNSDLRRNLNEVGIPGYHVTAKGLRDANGASLTGTGITDAKGIARFTTYVDSESSSPATAAISLGRVDAYRCLNQSSNDRGTIFGEASPSIHFAMVDYQNLNLTVWNSYQVSGSGEVVTRLIDRLVFDDLNGNARCDRGEPSARTDEDGEVWIKLHSGIHTLRVAPGDDWKAALGRSLAWRLDFHAGSPKATQGYFKITMKNPVIIDVLAAYTDSAAANNNGDAGGLIDDLIETANEVLANSDTNVRLRLVQAVHTDYVEAGDIESDLKHLSNARDGEMDDLLALRKTDHADLVTLISGVPVGSDGEIDDDVLGIGYEFNYGIGNSNALAFSVVRVGGGDDGFTFAHEIGHNLGAGHDVDHARNSHLPVPYAHGYVFSDVDGMLYQDVMAYGPGWVIPFFSTPLFHYAGKPIGNAGTADNARAIRQIAPDVARYR
jgi:hypothetical protein